MAVIGSIRKRGGLLVVLVAGALALFVLQGLWSSDNNQVTEEEKQTIAMVNGERVGYFEQQNELRSLYLQYELNNEKRVAPDQELEYQNMAMEALLTRKLWQEEMDELGIMLTTEGSRSELTDMFDPNGVTLPATVLTSFVGEDGKYDPQIFSQNLASLEAEGDENESYERRKFKQQWALFKNSTIKERARKKYLDLLVKSTYVPTFMAKRSYMENQANAAFNFLYVPYASIPDSTIDDKELNLEEFLSKNKKEFINQSDAVNVDLYAIRIEPSAQDTANLKSKVDSIYANWKTTSLNDTAYVKNFADNLDAVPTYVKYNMLPPAIKADSSLTAELNDLEYGKTAKYFEPEFNAVEGSYHMYKVSEIVLDTVWEMEASQIIFPVDERIDEMVQSTMDTLEKGSDFGAIAQSNIQYWRSVHGAFKQDYSSKVDDNGNIKNLLDETELYANDIKLRDALFAIEDTGLVSEVIETDYFRYIVYVKKTKSIKERVNKFLISDLANELEASDYTISDLYANAIAFQSACGKTKEGFYQQLEKDSLVDKKMNFTIDLGPKPIIFDRTTYRQKGSYATDFNGIEDKSRQILKWAWDNDEEAVPEFFQLQNAYVVAVIVSKEKKGEVKVGALEDFALKQKAMKARKQELIIEKLGEITKGDLVDIAAKYNEKHGLTGPNQMAVKFWNEGPHQLSNNNPYGNDGKGRLNEPAVIGTIFGLSPDKNSRSTPIRGEQGVFVVEVLKLDPGKPAEDGDYSAEQTAYEEKLIGGAQQNGQSGSVVESAISNVLRFKADIEDKRLYHF